MSTQTPDNTAESTTLTDTDQLPCWIYKSTRKDEMYVYLAEEDSFDTLPDALKKGFGEPMFVMELLLSTQRKLARANVDEMIKALQEEGFYLQMPPKLNPDLHFGD